MMIVYYSIVVAIGVVVPKSIGCTEIVVASNIVMLSLHLPELQAFVPAFERSCIAEGFQI